MDSPCLIRKTTPVSFKEHTTKSTKKNNLKLIKQEKNHNQTNKKLIHSINNNNNHDFSSLSDGNKDKTAFVATTPEPLTLNQHDKIKLVEINSYLTCYLCKGYLIDATTISECLHSFCRSCIIKFLQENCYCPVCEVIINKAKPCLKLDKTLQDIVYKLVPELFVREMHRRKQFYKQNSNNQQALSKLSPEQRGEDTERTIFNPQDAISLSIEYISDDSAPGAIPSLLPTENNDNTMKRYLQCPGMCRIEVLKKFVRNKYNVDTNLFHIDVLYKRVPLPDHYTLIDIGYIYSWKRNEPMKFFFRITDINKVSERFDYFDAKSKPQPVVFAAILNTNNNNNNNNNNVLKHHHAKKASQHSSNIGKSQQVIDKSESTKQLKKSELKKSTKVVVTSDKTKNLTKVIKTNNKHNLNAIISEKIALNKQKTDAVYTNLTLKRENNLEIVTKIQKKSGEHASKKSTSSSSSSSPSSTNKKVQNSINNNNNTNIVASKKTLQPKVSTNHSDVTPSKSETKNEDDNANLDPKEIFLKSIELTAKTPPKKPATPPKPTTITSSLPSAKLSSSPPVLPKVGQKRKNPSPIKSEEKRTKPNACSPLLKVPSVSSSSSNPPMKIIIHPKNVENATVRQMLTNVNQNVNSLSKIVVESSAPPHHHHHHHQYHKQKSNDLQSLIDNCKISIPSSLSITLNENGDGGARTSPQMAPVKNFIEILKLPGEHNTNDVIKSETCKAPSPGSDALLKQSFQKIFEESLSTKKTNDPTLKTLVTPPTITSTPNSNKRNSISEIALKLQKKTKSDNAASSEKQPESGQNSPRALLSPPALIKSNESAEKCRKSPTNQGVTVAKATLPRCDKFVVTSANCRSTSLGLNYTVSVGGVGAVVTSTSSASSSLSSASVTAGITTNNKAVKKLKLVDNGSTANQLLEKYNIQNLAQLSASFGGVGVGGAVPGAANLSALQHAMFLNHIKQQNWLNNHQGGGGGGGSGGALMQYEKYLQNLNAAQSKIMAANLKSKEKGAGLKLE